MKKPFHTSSTMHTDLCDCNDFADIFLNVIYPALESLETDAYCCYIDLKQTDSGTEVSIHDGGASCNLATDDIIYTYYLKQTVAQKLHEDITLYYSIEERVLCYLNER